MSEDGWVVFVFRRSVAAPRNCAVGDTVMKRIEQRDNREMRHDSLGHDLSALALRLCTGGLLAGHGAQKLFGSFGGYGLAGTAGWLESMGMRPGKPWAL